MDKQTNDHFKTITYHSFFVALNGKIYTAYANDIWNRFISGNNDFEFTGVLNEKIGIKNIRDTKLKRLNSEQEKWITEFQKNQRVIPGIKNLLNIKIDG